MTIPKKLTTPFANSGAKNDIPVQPYTEAGSTNKASWQAGFPPVTMMPIEAGGIPPEGMDMNGVLNEISAHTVYQNSGGLYKFDATFAAAIGGYPKGAVLLNDAETSSYISLADNNTENFNTGTPTKWEAFAGADVETLPEGGTAGQILTKTSTGADWKDNVTGVPSGGTNGQVLGKSNNNIAWINQVSGVPSGGSAGQVLTKTSSGYDWQAPAGNTSGVKKVTVTTSNFSKSGNYYNYSYTKQADNESFLAAYSNGSKIIVDAVDASGVITVKAIAAFAGYILISY